MGFSSISRVEICSTSMFLVDLCFILSSILFCIFMLRKILHGHVEEDPLSATDTIDSPLDEADKMVEEMPSEKRDTAPGASTIGKRATISGVHTTVRPNSNLNRIRIGFRASYHCSRLDLPM